MPDAHGKRRPMPTGTACRTCSGWVQSEGGVDSRFIVREYHAGLQIEGTGSKPMLYTSAQQWCSPTGRRASDGVAEENLTPPSYTAAVPSRATPK